MGCRVSLEHVSLFSGVGGFDLAMGGAGIPTHAVCEIDPHARGILARHLPDAHIYTDVRSVTGDSLRRLGLQPRRTILSAGFPCQDLSIAGSRRGMADGTRSGLYWEVDRILGEFRPAWVVLENVPGLLSACCACPGDGTCVARGITVRCTGDTHAVPGGACWGECIARHGGVMGAVLGSLAERGYGFAYRVLDAQFFGVPQRRRRVVIVGRLGDDGRSSAQVLLEPEGGPWNPAQGITPRPQTARAAGGSAGGCGVLGDIAHTLTAEGHDASEDGTGRGTPVVAHTLMARDRPSLDPSMETLVIAPPVASTLTAGTSRPGVSTPGRRQEDDHNIVAFTGQAAGDTYMPVGPIVPTISASQSHSPTVGTLGTGGGKPGQGYPAILSGTVVRRLTPLELERCQGFPDDWTAGQADSHRSKQMGNAIAVPVFEWVARRIVALDAA